MGKLRYDGEGMKRLNGPIETLGYVATDGRISPLPEWTSYLIKLGLYLVSFQIPNRRLVVGISMPTRSFGAAFAALGVSHAAYLDPGERNPEENFARFASMPSGTAIRFPRGRMLYHGSLIGTEKLGGVEHLTYYDSDGLKCYLRWDRCGAIELVKPEEHFIRPRLLAYNADFVAAVLGVDPFAHASYTCLDCLIVGTKDALRNEVLTQKFVSHRDETLQVEGSLNDLLRCDVFERNANDHDRTTFVSAFEDHVHERVLRERPPAVIFDGPKGFLRLRSYWRRSPWLVLLDRTSRSAVDAADAFNQEFAQSLGDADLSAIGEPPSQFEVCGYVEAVQ